MQFSVLLVASGLGLLALAYVLYPLYRHRQAKPAPVSLLPAKEGQPPTSDSEQAARLSLQEVELDYQLGNIAEADYRILRERYMRRVLIAMKSRSGNASGEHLEHENEQSTQDEQDTDMDELIEEQLRKMRETHEDNRGDKGAGGDGDVE